jgi:hypothetical protein
VFENGRRKRRRRKRDGGRVYIAATETMERGGTTV